MSDPLRFPDVSPNRQIQSDRDRIVCGGGVGRRVLPIRRWRCSLSVRQMIVSCNGEDRSDPYNTHDGRYANDLQLPPVYMNGPLLV